MEDNVVFSKASEKNNGQVTFGKKSQMKINNFTKQKLGYLIHSCLKAVKGTVVNR